MGDDRIHPERVVIGDAFGQILRQCHAADGAFGAAFELIERSDGYLSVMDAARYFVQPPDFSASSTFASEQAHGRVLDIGAGAGRVSLALQDTGCDVLALDVSEGATDVCRQRGVRSVLTGTVFDLAASHPEPFDTFVMLGNNLGLFGGLQQAPRFLDALASMASPEARIIGETVDPYQTNDPEHLAYQEQNRRMGRLAGQLRLRIRHQRAATPWWDYLFCTPDELDEVIAPTRWEVVGVHVARSGGGYGAGSRSWPRGQWAATLQLRR